MPAAAMAIASVHTPPQTASCSMGRAAAPGCWARRPPMASQKGCVHRAVPGGDLKEKAGRALKTP
eukprot:6446039-Alexandrium_andersonii.AAC.1